MIANYKWSSQIIRGFIKNYLERLLLYLGVIANPYKITVDTSKVETVLISSLIVFMEFNNSIVLKNSLEHNTNKLF